MGLVRSIAKFKLHLNRTWAIINIPIQLFQVALLLYLTIKESGNPLLWLSFPALGLLSLGVYWFDDKRFFTAETEYTVERTPSWVGMRDDIKAIQGDIAGINEKLRVVE